MILRKTAAFAPAPALSLATSSTGILPGPKNRTKNETRTRRFSAPGNHCLRPISAPAQDAPPPTQPKPLTPEASLNLKFLSDLQLSPDGTRLAFVVTEPPTDDGRATHIWLYDIRTNATRQFTYSKKSEKWPRWSPDGKQLAFLSNRVNERRTKSTQCALMAAKPSL